MLFSTSMHDMMVPSATDLCRLALQKSITTNFGSSLLTFTIASQVDWSRYTTTHQLCPDGGQGDACPGCSILLWIRELPCVDQHDPTIGNSLREKTPPSIRISNAFVVAGRKTVLDAGGHDHQVRPFLVWTSQWAVRVPCVTIDAPSAGCKHEGRSCRRRGYTKVLYKHTNKSPVSRILPHDALTYPLQVHPRPWSDMSSYNLFPVRPTHGPHLGSLAWTKLQLVPEIEVGPHKARMCQTLKVRVLIPLHP